MILRRGSVAAERVLGSAPRMEIRLGEAGGLTGLGVNVVTLAPGERSAKRHWHEEEDEFLLILDGEAAVVEDDGAHRLGPGDACAWPAGVANAHHVLNRSDAPVVYLVVGSQAVRDRVHYPDEGELLIHEPPEWRVLDREGRVLRFGPTDGP